MMDASCVERTLLHTTQVDTIEWISCCNWNCWYHDICISDPVEDAFVCNLYEQIKHV